MNKLIPLVFVAAGVGLLAFVLLRDREPTSGTSEIAEPGTEIDNFVSITCDPRNDSPAKLREYAALFQARPQQWYFLTGDLTYIRMIGRDAFKVPVDEKAHANRLMLVDKWGRVRGHFDWQDPRELERIEKQTRELLEETTPPEREA